jgi:hypothetical protein
MGRRAGAKVSFGDSEFPVEIVIDTANPSGPFLELAHQTRDWRGGAQDVRYRVGLIWSVPTYGGRRWWFQCPRTYRKATKLYLPNGGCYFWSRQAYRLGYACQREVPRDRAVRKLRKPDRALGGEGDGIPDEPPCKPQWMRWRTYDRKVAAWWRAADRVDGEMSAMLGQFLARYRR